jgi:aldose sugar dehydrogenase
VRGGILQSAAVLDTSVHYASERGLLGIAVHPDFPATPWVYLYLTQRAGGIADTNGSEVPAGNRIYRYTWTGSRLIDARLLLSLPVTPGPNHNGGILTFGPDGKLYAVIGDLNRNGRLQNYPSGPAPDHTSVIFRLNANGSTPSDNPFVSLGAPVSRYYAYGIRNAFGMAFDPVTDLLWMSENGPDAYDEVNLVRPGFNSGWERIMGPNDRDPQGTGDLVRLPGSHYSDPEFSWLDPIGPTAVAFLADSAFGSAYEDTLLVGDIVYGAISQFTLNPDRTGFVFPSLPGLRDLVADAASGRRAVRFGTGFGGVTDLKVGPDGLLYVVSYGGSIYVISPR